MGVNVYQQSHLLLGRELQSMGLGKGGAGGQVCHRIRKTTGKGHPDTQHSQHLLGGLLCQAFCLAAGPQAQSQRLFPSEPFWNEAGHKSISELTGTDRLSQTDQQGLCGTCLALAIPSRCGYPSSGFLCPSGTFPSEPSSLSLCGVLFGWGGYNKLPSTS